MLPEPVKGRYARDFGRSFLRRLPVIPAKVARHAREGGHLGPPPGSGFAPSGQRKASQEQKPPAIRRALPMIVVLSTHPSFRPGAP